MAPTILVVEDSPTQAERLRLLLEHKGYRVEVAANGKEGLAKLQEISPDLIVSDVIMPEMDGYAFCQAVKSTEATKRIPFVILTERKGPLDIIEGMMRGADNFITKPFEDAYLTARIERIFEGLELRKQGSLDVEITLRVANRNFLITADKQQIFELLFSVFEELGQVNTALREHERSLEARTEDLFQVNRRLQIANEALKQEIAKRKQAEREIEELYLNLQRRTIELEASNKELEAFSYSISHDLRAPLRAINGFSKILIEEHAAGLVPDARRYLGLVRSNTQQMGRLVDDLLAFSRLGRQPLRKATLNPADLVRQVLDDLRGDQAGRQVEITIGDLPSCRADASLLRQVWINLLSNAIKFTRQREVARIEIGSLTSAECGVRNVPEKE